MKLPGFLTLAYWRGGGGIEALTSETLALPGPASGQLAAEQKESLRQKLIADFQKARYGVTFRTQTFPGQVEGEREYYRALATSLDMGQWDIHRVIERDAQMESSVYPVATSNQAVRVVKSGLGFFDALEYLARYEVTRDAEPLSPGKDAMGNHHYVRFAMLHDIVFDLQGMPQPTIAGHAAVEGEYPVAALEQLNDIRQNTPRRDLMAKHALMEAHRQSSDLAKTFKVVMRQSERNRDHHRMNTYLEAWLDLVDDCWSSSDCCVPYKKGIDSYRSKFSYDIKEHKLSSFQWDWGMKDRVHDLYHDTVEAIHKLKDIDTGDRKAGLALLKEIAVTFLMQDAKYLVSKLDRAVGSNPDPKTMETIETLSNQYTTILFGPVTKAVSFGVHGSAFIARAMSEPRLTKAPPHFREVLEQLQGKQRALGKEVSDTWSGVRGPKP